MKAGTQVLVAACILALGAATLLLASTQSDAHVRFVDQVLADPGQHTRGQYILMGIPQPAQVPYTGPNGTVLAPNPQFNDTTVWTTAWSRSGATYYSTHTLRVQSTAAELTWEFRNETRSRPADAEPAFPPIASTWHLGAGAQAFPVASFTGHDRVWAFYPKGTEHPLEPKPSQFTGRLLHELPDGTPLPDGALVYSVSDYTAGCSSKFLPPELKEKYGS